MHSGPKYPRGLTLVAFGFDSVIELASAGVLIWRVAVENKRGEKCSGFRALLYEHSLGTLATSKRRFFTSGIVATNGVRRTIVDRGAHSPRIEIDHVYGTYEDDRTFSLARFPTIAIGHQLLPKKSIETTMRPQNRLTFF